ncbi:GNAT family N-acetyltransferase [Dictyoglomus thermophilum]|uniref:GNAT family N-acetyltransferase n=1 Tax=Dictyoglomus thermophilum TaxID=14 RepID=UPI0011EAA49C|nr:GNAT family protein [Dictyoglomus thermophilum]TYT23271.1 GNAT family N-acetyltransferase [Dictyoglomus thermophilum]
MYYKKLIGKRCYLSPIDIEDCQKYTRWVNDMEVVIGLTIASNLYTEQKEREVLERLSKSDYNFAIVDLEREELIGNIGFVNLDLINKVGELGIFIGNKDYWGKGYGVEAIQLLLDFGFNILNLHNVYLRVFSFNKPAINCYKKIGFKEVGRIREAKQIAGERYDIIIMDILENEYKSIYIKDLVEKKKQY